MKNTKARDIILEIIKKADGPITAEAIYHELISSNINLSTVYRTLLTFENEGLIIKDMGQEGKSVYMIKHEEHYHILECQVCHKKIYLDYCPYHEAIHEIAEKTGFYVEEHNIVIYGICPECQDKTKTSKIELSAK